MGSPDFSEGRSVAPSTTVGCDLPPDRCAVAPDPVRDRRIGLASFDPDPDLFALSQAQGPSPSYALA
jgi:hypothetical protein